MAIWRAQLWAIANSALVPVQSASGTQEAYSRADRGSAYSGSADRHGRIALAIGVIASLGLGIGLMGLVFYSSNHGYDEGTRRP